MKKSETFNFGRFAEYFVFDFKRAVRDKWLTTLITALVPAILFVLTAFWAAATSQAGSWSTDILLTDKIAAIVSVLYFLLLPISLYGGFTERKEGGMWLMTPSSHTEKFISMLLNGVVIFPAAFIAMYLGCDWLLSVIFPAHCDIPLVRALSATLSSGPSEDPLIHGAAWFFLPLTVSSAGLCGAFLFRKGKSTKTFLTCALSFILLVFAINIVNELAGDSREFIEKNIYTLSFWYIFQSAAAMCCLAWVYFKTRKMQL